MGWNEVAACINTTPGHMIPSPNTRGIDTEGGKGCRFTITLRWALQTQTQTLLTSPGVELHHQETGQALPLVSAADG